MLRQRQSTLLLILKHVVMSIPISAFLICHPGWTRTPEAEVVYYAQQLADENADLTQRVNAAAALGNPYLGKEDAVQSLITALEEDPDASVRITAAVALANRSSNRQRQFLLPLFQSATPALVDILDQRQEPNPNVRAKAANALGDIILQAKKYASLTAQDEVTIDRAAKALLIALEDTTQGDEVRAEAAHALGLVGKSAEASVTTLANIVDNEAENDILRARAAGALAWLKSEGISEAQALDALIEILEKDSEVGLRSSTVSALATLGVDAPERSVVTLVNVLKTDPELEVRTRAAYALSSVAFDERSIAALVVILKDETENVNLRTIAASSLRVMSDTFDTPLPSSAIAALVSAVSHPDPELKANAVLALKSAEVSEAHKVLPALIDLLEHEVYWVRTNAAEALKEVVVGFQDEGETDQYSLAELDQFITRAEEAFIVLEQAEADGFLDDQYATYVNRSLEFLRLQRQTRLLDQTLNWFKNNPWQWIVLGYLVGLPLFWIILFWVRPLWLLKIDRMLAPLKNIELPGVLASGFNLTFQTILYITFFEFFHYRNRVLDAWVINYLEEAKTRFQEDKTAAFHRTRVPIAVTLNDESVTDLSGRDLRPAFTRNLTYLSVLGEGGSGKTSLACQIAKWGMSIHRSQLCEHPMLPVLIDHDFNLEQENDTDALLRAVSRQLQQLIDENKPIPDELLNQLLRKRRVLVIMDGLSEMSSNTRKSIRFGQPDFPINALIVTSRLPNIIQGFDSAIEIKPQKLEKDSLSNFVKNYLKELNKYDAFDGSEYFNDCLKLTTLVGDRGITVLLAKLYVEEMAQKKEAKSNKSLSESIPDLMLNYLHNLNSRYVDEIQKDMKRIAWESLKENYQPGPVRRENILNCLGDDEEIARDKLDHFETELGLIKTLWPNHNLLQITLDPLAEYLASLFILETYGDDEEKWQNLLKQLDFNSVERIRGFILAVQDCCDYRKNPLHPRFALGKPPSFVLDELDALSRVSPGQ